MPRGYGRLTCLSQEGKPTSLLLRHLSPGGGWHLGSSISAPFLERFWGPLTFPRRAASSRGRWIFMCEFRLLILSNTLEVRKQSGIFFKCRLFFKPVNSVRTSVLISISVRYDAGRDWVVAS